MPHRNTIKDYHKAGLDKMVILVIALFMTGAATASVSYRTPEMRRLAKVIGISEGSLVPGENHIGNYTVTVDESMMVRHVGLSLFTEEVKNMSERHVLEFVERYFLQLLHPAPNSSPALMIQSDGISFSHGKWQDISKITPSTPFTLNYHLMRYTLTWTDKNTKLSFSFPGKYQLICGENLPQAEEHLYDDIIKTVCLLHPAPDLSNMRPSSMDGYYIMKGSWFETETLNSSTYYHRENNGSLIPVVNTDFIEESVSNIMICPNAAMPFQLDITLHGYGFKDRNFKVPAHQWIDYCIQNGCEIYCGIESVKQNMVKATVLAVNPKLNFNHLLNISVPVSVIGNGHGSIKADLNAFIPTHNIINQKAKYKKNKKIGNRFINNI